MSGSLWTKFETFIFAYLKYLFSSIIIIILYLHFYLVHKYAANIHIFAAKILPLKYNIFASKNQQLIFFNV